MEGLVPWRVWLPHSLIRAATHPGPLVQGLQSCFSEGDWSPALLTVAPGGAPLWLHPGWAFCCRGSHHAVSSVGRFQFDFTCTPRKGKAILSICQANLKAHVRSLGGELRPITAN